MRKNMMKQCPITRRKRVMKAVSNYAAERITLRMAKSYARTNCLRRISLSLLLVALFAGVKQIPASAQTTFRYTTLFSTIYDNTTSAGDQILSPSMNNNGDVLWAGQTQSGPRVYLNSPSNNLAAGVPNADTIIDTRLPRFGTNSANAVWDGLTGEIDPNTGLALPNSNYQEDHIYLNKNGVSSLIGKTQFGGSFGTFSAPDVNDKGQAAFRRLDYGNFTWSLYVHDGSGLLSGTTIPLSGYYSIGTTYINANGNIAFFSRPTAADVSQLTIYNPTTGTFTHPIGANLTGASLLEYNDDGSAFMFLGSSTAGSYYIVEKNGNITQALTAGTNGTVRLSNAYRNNNGQFVFINRTQLGASGATPTYGLSDLELYNNGSILNISNDQPGTVIGGANINDNGDVVFVTQRYLYDATGNYLHQSQYTLTLATAVPEPGNIALMLGAMAFGAAVLKRRRRLKFS